MAEGPYLPYYLTSLWAEGLWVTSPVCLLDFVFILQETKPYKCCIWANFIILLQRLANTFMEVLNEKHRYN